MQSRRRKFWGWGWEDAGPNAEQQGRIAMLLAARLGIDVPTVGTPPRIEEVTLRAARVAPPAALASLCSTTPLDRAGHTYGKSFRDVVRGFARDFANPPDVVAFPTDEAEVAALLAWCSDAGLAAIPYGGGSSVVGGVEAPPADRFPDVVSIDLGRLDRVPDGVAVRRRLQRRRQLQRGGHPVRGRPLRAPVQRQRQLQRSHDAVQRGLVRGRVHGRRCGLRAGRVRRRLHLLGALPLRPR